MNNKIYEKVLFMLRIWI